MVPDHLSGHMWLFGWNSAEQYSFFPADWFFVFVVRFLFKLRQSLLAKVDITWPFIPTFHKVYDFPCPCNNSLKTNLEPVTLHVHGMCFSLATGFLRIFGFKFLNFFRRFRISGLLYLISSLYGNSVCVSPPTQKCQETLK